MLILILQQTLHHGQMIREPEIVVAQIADSFTRCLHQGIVPGEFAMPLPLLVFQEPDPGIRLRKMLDSPVRSRRRAVGDDEKFEILPGLTQNAPDGASDQVAIVEGGDQDGEAHISTKGEIDAFLDRGNDRRFVGQT